MKVKVSLYQGPIEEWVTFFQAVAEKYPGTYVESILDESFLVLALPTSDQLMSDDGIDFFSGFCKNSVICAWRVV